MDGDRLTALYLCVNHTPKITLEFPNPAKPAKPRVSKSC